MVHCKICDREYKNIYQHNITSKHLIKARDYKSQEKLKQINKNIVNKLKCDICDKLISTCNFSHHKATKKHKIKFDSNFLLNEDDLASVEEIDLL